MKIAGRRKLASKTVKPKPALKKGKPMIGKVQMAVLIALATLLLTTGSTVAITVLVCYDVNGQPFTVIGNACPDPGQHPLVPFLPQAAANGAFLFTNPQPGGWFDPPLAIGFEYELQGGATFTQVGVPPPSFGFDPIDVVVSGITVATLNPDELYSFSSGITAFSLLGISPAVDAGDPTAFPTFLDWSGQASSLTMTAIPAATVPEPSTLMLLGLGVAGLVAYRRRYKSV